MKRGSKLPHWPPRWSALSARWRWQSIAKVLLALFTAGVLTALVFYHLDYYQVGTTLEQFRVDSPAPRDILATDTVRWLDEDATTRLRDEAAARVTPVFTQDRNAPEKAQSDLDQVFHVLGSGELTPEQLRELEQIQIPDFAITGLQGLSPDHLDIVHAAAKGMLQTVEGELAKLPERHDDAQAQTRLGELAKERLPKNAEQQRLAVAVTRAVMRPVWIEDVSRFEELREAARRDVNPVVRVVQKGDVILQQGEIVTASDLDQLRTKHLLNPAPLKRLLPVAGLMLFAVFAIGVYLRSYCPLVYQNNRRLVLLASLLIAPLYANLTLGKGEMEFLVGLLIIPAGSMAIAGLLGVPVAIIATLFLSVTAGVTADNSFGIVLLTLGSSLVGLMAVSAIWPASRATLPAVLSLVIINLLLLISLEGIRPGGSLLLDWQELARFTLWGAAGGLGATFFAVGAIYMLARPFGITTHYRLMELSNPDEPLLRRMIVETPGSYHSSVMVSNLAEAAANAIDANALLTRIAALYHDIGKLKRPAFFIENQAPLGVENIHQRLSPRLSYLILTSHVRDGVELAQKYKLPEEVVNIIREHHGTTLAAYFYHRALNEAGSSQVSEIDFRYPGPKPSTRESALVMLADSVQASVKALKDPSPNRIDSMVREIIDSRLSDGQFEDCNITLRDLRAIADEFVRILSGLYSYTRLEYPDMKSEGMRLRANVHTEPTTEAGEPPMLTRSS